VDRVQFDRVSKRYRLGELTPSPGAGGDGGARRLLGRGTPGDPAEVWSLRDVSFSVADGEALGIIGRNGAGKSTVLKVLTGITAPTRGVARSRGRVAALLEVGTGFHPDLTGRENVFLNGAILGMSRRDIRRNFDAIVEFAGTEAFLDTPVKRYSSGMALRLAFAVAAHLEPDVLVVDEVLAVGDAEFQRKCLGKMTEAEAEGRTLLFVSHDLQSLVRLCSRALWLDGGRVRRDGPSRELVREYLSGGLAGEPGATAVRGGPVELHGVRVLRDGAPTTTVMRDEELVVEVDFSLSRRVPGFDLAVYLTTAGGTRVLDEALRDVGTLGLDPGRWVARLAVPPVLNVGDHTVGVWTGTAYEDFFDQPLTARVTVQGSDLGRPARTVVLGLPVTVERADAARPVAS